MWVKICANTSSEDALTAVEAGADAVGFVFAPSKRQVTTEQVTAITGKLPASVEKVGVFASDDAFEIERDVACSGLTAAQLHRAFKPDLVRTLSNAFGGELKIIQTVAYSLDAADRVRADKAFLAAVREVLAERSVWAILVDAAKSGVSGGLGLAFDWKHVGALLREAGEAESGQPPRVIMAGGLRPENVAAAIADFAPWGVDVASGVEISAGKKDPVRLRQFIAAARN